jgi:hypothetical protein
MNSQRAPPWTTRLPPLFDCQLELNVGEVYPVISDLLMIKQNLDRP